MPKSPSPTPEHTPLGDRKKLLIYCAMVIAVAVVFTAVAIALMVRAPESASTGSNIKIEGTMQCLPHKGDGPHTLECAYGLRTDDNRYYGLKDAPEAITDFSTGTRVTVEGILRSNPDSQYNIVGDIDVKSIAR